MFDAQWMAAKQAYLETLRFIVTHDLDARDEGEEAAGTGTEGGPSPSMHDEGGGHQEAEEDEEVSGCGRKEGMGREHCGQVPSQSCRWRRCRPFSRPQHFLAPFPLAPSVTPCHTVPYWSLYSVHNPPPSLPPSLPFSQDGPPSLPLLLADSLRVALASVLIDLSQLPFLNVALSALSARARYPELQVPPFSGYWPAWRALVAAEVRGGGREGGREGGRQEGREVRVLTKLRKQSIGARA
jgi:hypothetical protein